LTDYKTINILIPVW